MNKALLIQSPAKFFHVAQIFCDVLSERDDLVDRVYVATDAEKELQCDDRFKKIQLDKDYQFSGNMIRALPEVEEDVFLVCCDDHVLKDENDPDVWDQCFRFFDEEPAAGFLRLTYTDRVPLRRPKKFISRIKRDYKYYVSLQPAIWRREFFLTALQEGEDAWAFELQGAKRCRALDGMRSYGVNHTVFHCTNFLKSGKYYRRQYVDYMLEQGLGDELDHNAKVDRKSEVITVAEYIRRRNKERA